MERSIKYHENILEQMHRSARVLRKNSDRHYNLLLEIANKSKDLQIQILMAKRQGLERFDAETYLADELA